MGTVEFLDSQIKSSWWLRPVRDGSEETRSRESETAQWLAVRAALDQVDEEIRIAEQRSPEMRVEIERLTEYVTEGRSLKSRADQKFALEKENLRRVSEKLLARQKEAQELESRIELSQRVTEMGKLVSLAREAREREGRWIDSMFAGSAAAAGSEEDLQKAAGILEVKRALELEQDRIARLEASGGGRE